MIRAKAPRLPVTLFAAVLLTAGCSGSESPGASDDESSVTGASNSTVMENDLPFVPVVDVPSSETETETETEAEAELPASSEISSG